MTAQQPRGPERNADDPVLDRAQTWGIPEALRTPRDETVQGNSLRLDYDELSQDISKHSGHMDCGSSISSQDLDLDYLNGGSNETYGAYISGMRLLARHEAEQGDTGGLSDLVVSLDSNKVVPHNRTASKVHGAGGGCHNAPVCREKIHPIDNRPVPKRARLMSIIPLIRKQTTRGTRGETRLSGILSISISSSGAIADLFSESSSNRRRAGEPTRRSSVRHLGSVFSGLVGRSRVSTSD